MRYSKCWKLRLKNSQEKVYDWGREYYGRHNDVGQIIGPFAQYLHNSGIVGQFTICGSLEQNGVVEKWNHALVEMVRWIMSKTNLPYFLWGEALRTTM